MPVVTDNRDLVQRIVELRRHQPAALLTVLQDIQDELHWLPRDVLVAVSEILQVPLPRVYRVASFYRALSLEPRGEHLIRVCTGTACHLRGAPALIDAIQRTIGIGPGETSPDLRFSLETVNCLGACALAPVMVVDGDYHRSVKPADVPGILNQY